MAVLPNSDYVWEEEDCGLWVDGGAGGGGDVGFDSVGEFDRFAGWGASREEMLVRYWAGVARLYWLEGAWSSFQVNKIYVSYWRAGRWGYMRV